MIDAADIHTTLSRQLAAIDSMSAVRGRRSAKSDIFIFESPKNAKRFAVETTEVYFSAVLLEGDYTVDWYLPERRSMTVMSDGESKVIEIDLEVHYLDGAIAWLKHGNSETNGGRENRLQRSGVTCRCVATGREGQYRVIARSDLHERQVEFHNWLTILGMTIRSRRLPREQELQAVRAKLSGSTEVTLDDLCQLDGCDPAIVQAIVADGLRTGVFRTNLKTQDFTRVSIICLA